MSTHAEDSQQINWNDVRKAHAILHQPGQQVEIRVLLKEGGAMSGRFDDEGKMLGWLKDADSPDVAVAWWTIQQLSPGACHERLAAPQGQRQRIHGRPPLDFHRR